VPAKDFAEVKRVVEEELGAPLAQFFSKFDEVRCYHSY
jgi:predicted unusual protein kinase regulating ubiquinone biosynthesis (AarF/ABC1/UbiB family)